MKNIQKITYSVQMLSFTILLSSGLTNTVLSMNRKPTVVQNQFHRRTDQGEVITTTIDYLPQESESLLGQVSNHIKLGVASGLGEASKALMAQVVVQVGLRIFEGINHQIHYVCNPKRYATIKKETELQKKAEQFALLQALENQTDDPQVLAEIRLSKQALIKTMSHNIFQQVQPTDEKAKINSIHNEIDSPHIFPLSIPIAEDEIPALELLPELHINNDDISGEKFDTSIQTVESDTQENNDAQ